MYAVIKSGGKQHRVVEGEKLKVELLNAEPGQSITLEDILMVVNGDNIQIGTPVVAGAKVTAEVLGHGRHDKVRIVKMRRRKHYRKQQGHRQWFTELKITGIDVLNGGYSSWHIRKRVVLPVTAATHRPNV